MINNNKKKRIIYLNSISNYENIFSIKEKLARYLSSIDYKIIDKNIKIKLRNINYPELVYKIIKSIEELKSTKEKLVYNKKGLDKDQEKVIKNKGINPLDYRITEFIIEKDKDLEKKKEKEKIRRLDHYYNIDKLRL